MSVITFSSHGQRHDPEARIVLHLSFCIHTSSGQTESIESIPDCWQRYILHDIMWWKLNLLIKSNRQRFTHNTLRLVSVVAIFLSHCAKTLAWLWLCIHIASCFSCEHLQCKLLMRVVIFKLPSKTHHLLDILVYKWFLTDFPIKTSICRVFSSQPRLNTGGSIWPGAQLIPMLSHCHGDVVTYGVPFQSAVACGPWGHHGDILGIYPIRME